MIVDVPQKSAHIPLHCTLVDPEYITAVAAAVAVNVATTASSLLHKNVHPGGHRAPPHPRALPHAPPNNMLIVTSLFKPDAAALLPRQRRTR